MCRYIIVQEHLVANKWTETQLYSFELDALSQSKINALSLIFCFIQLKMTNSTHNINSYPRTKKLFLFTNSSWTFTNWIGCSRTVRERSPAVRERSRTARERSPAVRERSWTAGERSWTVTLIMKFINNQINKQTNTVRELFMNRYTNSKPWYFLACVALRRRVGVSLELWNFSSNY